MTTNAAVGSLAPDFDLPSTAAAGRSRLADFRGRWLVLIFYPRDFSLVCPTELTAIGARIEEFTRRGCDALGISADTLESHQRWIGTPRAQGGLSGLGYPLASDVSGAACRDYGVFLETQHVALRGLFIIDPNSVLQYQVVHNLSVGRRTDEILRVLAALQTGGLCAENWSPGESTLDKPRSLGPGSVLSHYRIEEQIGSGAFASVFRAQDTTLHRSVALKVLKVGSPANAGAVLAEARAAAALNHVNVCTVYSVDDSEGVPVIAMEYLAGRPLSRVIEDGPLSAESCANLAQQIAAGMAAAHARGIVHGDLKPANIFVTDSGVVKLLDFGLSRREVRSATPDDTTDLLGISSGSLAGTPCYMSPEQANGERATIASDVFSLGTMLYEMFSGQRAFDGDNVLQVLNRIRHADAAALASQLPEPFAAIVRKALVHDPRERDATMQDIADELANCATGPLAT
ncbi:MAG TPA: protein kinase [Pirellulales bacterium]|jgi:alkyl hydroperoxide reductase subunit AhpC